MYRSIDYFDVIAKNKSGTVVLRMTNMNIEKNICIRSIETEYDIDQIEEIIEHLKIAIDYARNEES